MLKSLLLRFIGIIIGPIGVVMFGIMGGFVHYFSGNCGVLEELGWGCPGVWFHILVVAIGFPLQIVILTGVFEGQNLIEVVEKQNSAYFSS